MPVMSTLLTKRILKLKEICDLEQKKWVKRYDLANVGKNTGNATGRAW